ncbi:MAG: hypothetical protein HOD92_20970 [Deltaproteobacteria bacterium]|jgi:hypothetical protein|nr:hypothetical protein [Deltaproteobacteria bacterium]MBT4527728.1 hypothetical protein [Deltaproteobacteria bacterium]
MIGKEALDSLHNIYLLDILKAENLRASSALVAYARFLNDEKLEYNLFPLYLKIFDSNNQFAIDALLNNYEPEKFLEIIIVPNSYVLENVFSLFTKFKSEGMYNKVQRVFCGFLHSVYHIVEEGVRFYLPTIADINNVGKHLVEDEDQEFPLNRVILDFLSCITDLDSFAHKDFQDRIEIARQASKIRSDYFDNRRKLIQSITEIVLEKDSDPNFGVTPDQMYLSE